MKPTLLISITVMLLSGFGAITSVNAQQFSDWAVPVNLGPVINTEKTDACTTVSKNGLKLFFRSNYTGTNLLYVSYRTSVDGPWGTPQLVTYIDGTPFGDGYFIACPALSPDEHRLFFQSIRPENCGGWSASDLWVSRRHDRTNDFGWEKPVNLGCEPDGPNSTFGEATPTVFEDETGVEVMYFGSGRGPGVWESHGRNDDTFGPATLVEELSTPQGESAAVRHDGLEVILSSGRPGGPNVVNFWTSTRESTADKWSPPVFEPVLSSYPGNGTGRMQISFDGCEFYFSAYNRPGGYGLYDIYVARREKLRRKQ